jgi:S-methylmethionine-dependent homocysteine/selenocysteine methylase
MKYRDRLPQLDSDLFLTDGGLETVLVFHEGFDLPAFAAFDLLKDEAGTAALRAYYAPYAALASEHGVGFVAESPTWRASPRWAAEIGYSPEQLDAFNRRSIALMEDVRAEYETERSPVVISGCVGPSDDGYNPAELLSADVAEAYHSTQIETFAGTAADMVTAITMTYAEEAIGITRASQRVGLPVVISFTLETDGRLPSGESLRDAIEQVDDETGAGPAYYMINCAHPTHFDGVLDAGEPWLDRIRGLRANASTRSHAELDEATELDDGDPTDLGERYAALAAKLPRLSVLGGCCGTDHRHVSAIAGAWPVRA